MWGRLADTQESSEVTRRFDVRLVWCDAVDRNDVESFHHSGFLDRKRMRVNGFESSCCVFSFGSVSE